MSPETNLLHAIYHTYRTGIYCQECKISLWQLHDINRWSCRPCNRYPRRQSNRHSLMPAFGPFKLEESGNNKQMGNTSSAATDGCKVRQQAEAIIAGGRSEWKHLAAMGYMTGRRKSSRTSSLHSSVARFDVNFLVVTLRLPCMLAATGAAAQMSSVGTAALSPPTLRC